MDTEIKSVLDFLEEQTVKQASHFPALPCGQVLSFMATTSRPGVHASVSVNPIRALAPADSGSGLEVHLQGPLPRPPTEGECITVHVTRVENYQGYQIKSLPASAGGVADALYLQDRDELVVKGTQIFTVHHSPYTMKFFEQIPYEEVDQIVGGGKCALVAVGELVNISPRFVFHYELEHGRLSLFHGDGLALKTYVNLKSNRQETRLLLDLDLFSGYALEGTVDEFSPHQHPEAYQRICEGFSAGDWGKPSRVFRLRVDRLRPIEPAGRL